MRARCKDHPSVELEDEDCGRCGGEGMIEDDDDLLYERPPIVSCWGCAGRGVLREVTCYLCNEEIEDEMYRDLG